LIVVPALAFYEAVAMHPLRPHDHLPHPVLMRAGDFEGVVDAADWRAEANSSELGACLTSFPN
jgi:hypothetical protein